MAGYPIQGGKGTITSVTSSTANNLHNLLILASRQTTLNWSFASDVEPITSLDGSVTAIENLTGLRSGSFTFEGLYPRASPRNGNSGLVTFAAGFVEFCDQFTLNIEFGEQDITPYDGTAIGWKRFMPNDIIEWSGTFTPRATSGTATALPTAIDGVGTAATFKLTEDAAADPAFSGNIVVTGETFTVAHNQQVRPAYTFMGSGTLTETVGTNLAGILRATTGTVSASAWDLDSDGVPDITVLGQTFTNRTYSGTAFLKSFALTHNIGQPIRLSGEVRYAGVVTTA